MEKHEKLVYYPSGTLCQHCAWIDEAYASIPRKIRIPKQKPFIYVLNADENFRGCTVYDSSNFYRHTVAVILGLTSKDHSTTDIASILNGSAHYVEFLYQKYGICDVRLLVNCHYSEKKYGGKEHVHAWLTMDSKIDKDIFEQKISSDKARYSTEYKPYKDDKIANISCEEGKKMIRMKNPELLGFIGSKIGKDPNTTGFYIFLRFSCEKKKGCVEGEISY
jgi:hypothetical protein